MAFHSINIKSLYKFIILLLVFGLFNKLCSAQDNDNEIKNIYALQAVDEVRLFLLINPSC
jgi:hypothetical protein